VDMPMGKRFGSILVYINVRRSEKRIGNEVGLNFDVGHGQPTTIRADATFSTRRAIAATSPSRFDFTRAVAK
jgi:hypothetical protein